MASLEGVDAQLELAALTLGASRLRVLWEVVIPLVAPGLLSALLFAFMVSFGDVYIALFLSGPGRTTLPIEIFAYMQWESTPVVAAITIDADPADHRARPGHRAPGRPAQDHARMMQTMPIDQTEEDRDHQRRP